MVLCFHAGAGFATAYADATNWFEAGLQALNAGDYDRAVERFSTALEIYPQDYEALSHRGVARFRKGVYGAAIEDATRALAVNPYYIVGTNQLAWMLATCPDPRFRDGRRAVVLAKSVAARSPEANFLDTLAAAHAENGDMAAAVRVQRLAVARLKAEVAVVDREAFYQRLSRYTRALEASKGQHTDAWPNAASPDSSMRGTATPPASMAPAKDPVVAPDSANQKQASATCYSVHISSLRNGQWAEETAAAFSKGPCSAFVRRMDLEGDPVPWFRIYVGRFDNRQAALECARDLVQRGHTWSRVVVHPSGGE